MISLALVVLGGLATPWFTAPAPTPDDFDQAVASSGADYQDARNRLLRPGVELQSITNKLRSDLHQERLTAKMILGWRAHGEEYTKLLGQFLTDITGARRYTWTYDPGAIKPEYLPLMYEMLAKEVGGRSGQDAAVRVINYLARQGADVDVKALTQLLREQRTPASSRAAIARTIAALPRSMVETDDLLALLKQEGARKPGDKDVAAALLNGLIPRGNQLSDQSRDQVVDRLLKMADVQALVGETAIVTTAGSVGGHHAATRVAAFLDQAQRPAQRRWAISTLSSIGDETAAKALNKAALNQGLTERERVYVIGQLSRVAYTTEVGNTLGAIIGSRDRTDRERSEAISTLEKLFNANLRNQRAAQDLRSRLERLDPASATSNALKTKMREAKSRLAR
jgi:hypothetical protein